MRGSLFAVSACLPALSSLTLFCVMLGCGNGKPAADATGNSDPSAEGTSEPDSSNPTPSSTANGKARSRVNEKSERSLNTYDKEQTDVVLARAARQVKQNCGATKDETGAATGPWGKVSVKVTLGHNGHSRGTVVPAPYEGKPVGRCIAQAFSNLTIPPWAGEDTDVEWPVELVKPEAATPPPKGK